MAYYFLGSLISPLSLDKRPEMSWLEFRDLLEINLSSKDLDQMRTVLRFFDLENLRLHLTDAKLSVHGNLSAIEFDSLFLETELLEPWWECFIENQGYEKKDLNLVSQLEHEFFAASTALDSSSGRILSKLWKSQWMAAYVRLEEKLSSEALDKEPGFEHQRVQQWLLEFQQGLGGKELEALKTIWQPSGQTLEDISKSYIQWQIEFFEADQLEHPFNLEALLGYLIQLAWVERWQNRHTPQIWDPNDSVQEALNLLAAHGINTHAITSHG